MNVAILSIESILPCSSLPKALSFSFRRFLSIRTPRSCHAVKHFKGFSLQHAAMAEQIRTSHPGHPGIVSVSIMIVYWYVFVRDLHAYKGKTMRHQQVCLSATFPACWEPLLQIFATTCMTRNNVLRTCVAKAPQHSKVHTTFKNNQTYLPNAIIHNNHKDDRHHCNFESGCTSISLEWLRNFIDFAQKDKSKRGTRLASLDAAQNLRIGAPELIVEIHQVPRLPGFELCITLQQKDRSGKWQGCMESSVDSAGFRVIDG